MEARICSGCDEAIPAERLKAEPPATMCVDCQADREKKPDEPQARETSEYLTAESERKAELRQRKSRDSRII
jgi:RNA polymerase-binding transcription factor DksA